MTLLQVVRARRPRRCGTARLRFAAPRAALAAIAPEPAPHAQANVSIPVLVLKSHIAQLPGTHRLKLISSDNRTGKKTTTALRPITLGQGICQPKLRIRSPSQMRLRRGALSPKLNPQPEPPSIMHRLGRPAR